MSDMQHEKMPEDTASQSPTTDSTAPADAGVPSAPKPAEGGKRKKQKKKRQPYVDDGHTVYDMSGVRRPWEGTGKENPVGLTRREKWAAIRAAFGRYLPVLLIVLGCFALTLGLMYLWLT